MLRRIASLIVIVWALGFVWFTIALPDPAGDQKTDAVVVLTGGEGRIARGLEVLDKSWASRMLVAGVDKEVRPVEFAVQYKIGAAQMACCITLGFRSVDTRSNAREVAEWISANRLQSVRLVTSDWHMRRAAFELAVALPGTVKVIDDAVQTNPSFRILMLEYHKLLARRMSHLWGA